MGNDPMSLFESNLQLYALGPLESYSIQTEEPGQEQLNVLANSEPEKVD